MSSQSNLLNKELFNCEKCGMKYSLNTEYKWCDFCKILKNFNNWTSGNEIIDDFIREKQLKFDKHDDVMVFEWIPYDQFKNIKEINKDGETTLYSAMWENGPLYFDHNDGWIRNSEKVDLKCFNNSQNSQNITHEFVNEIKQYSTKYDIIIGSAIYGISQKPDTKDYIMVLYHNHCEECGKKYTNSYKKWCMSCQINNLKNRTSGNKIIDDFIQEKQFKFDSYDIFFEWIPYNQFKIIKEIGKDGETLLYVAIWKNGPLYFDKDNNKKEWTRKSDEIVDLKCFYNSQNIIDEFLNEVKEYSIKQPGYPDYKTADVIYGISQKPDTKDYIMVLYNNYCEVCEKIYTNTYEKWCKPCQINNFKNNFTNWTSENKIIDDFIQEVQLNIKYGRNRSVFEWIPYNQFNIIKEIGKGGFSTVYLAIWNDGPLVYDVNKKKYTRKLVNKEVALKYLHNSSNIPNEFLNEVKVHLIKESGHIINIYGISQNPNTKDYIMVLENAEGGNLNNWANKNYKDFSWKQKIRILTNILYGLKDIHQKQMVHRDFHTGNILLKNKNFPYISDMGLCQEVSNIDETKIYGVMPFVAPEVLIGKPYTKAADIYSFGMLMYHVATGRQPFANCAHNQYLALNICNGVRPEITEPQAPKCYIDLMKRCWDSNPNNRPNVTEILELFTLFYGLYSKFQKNYEKQIEEQIEEAEKYRQANLLTIENDQQTTHSQAVYTSRLLNPFTENLPKYDNINNNTVEIIDFTNLKIENKNDVKK